MAAKVASNSKGFQPDSDVHITFDDQQKINQFAKHNARLEDHKAELEVLKNELKQVEEAKDEIELSDESDLIWSLKGEVFISNDLDGTQDYLSETQEKIKKEIKDIEGKCTELQEVMGTLKAQLYLRFGNNISLEGDD